MKVPTYDSPQVLPSAIQSGHFDAQAIPDVAGRQMQESGQATLAAGNTMVSVAQRIQDERDEARAQEAENTLSDRIRTILHDPEKGYFSRLGKGAVDSLGDYQKAMEAARKEVEGGLSTDMQRLMFKRSADKRIQLSGAQMDGHAAQQLKVYRIGEGEKALDNARRDALGFAAGFDDPKSSYQIYKGAMVARANQLADLSELPADSEQRKSLVLNATTQLHFDAISNLVSTGQSSVAQKYLASALKTGEIASDAVDKLSSLVKTASLKDDSLKLSMTLKGGLQEQIKALDKMFSAGEISADIRDATVQRVEHNWQQRKAQQEEGNKYAMGNAQDWLLKNPGKSVLDMPPNLYEWAKREGHLAGLDAFAKREGRPASRNAELKVRGELLQLAANDPDAFIAEFKRSGFVDRLDLGSDGIKEMQTNASNMMAGSGKYRVAFDASRIKDMMPKSLENDKDKKAAFFGLAAEFESAWKKSNQGKQPADRDYQDLASYVNREFTSIGMWNVNNKYYNLSESNRATAIPAETFNTMRAIGKKKDDEILAFSQAARARGASWEEVQKMWAIKQGNK